MHSFYTLVSTFLLSSWLLISCAEPALTLTEPDDDELMEFTVRDDTYYFQTGAGVYKLQFYSQEVLEVSFQPSGSESEKAAIKKAKEQSGRDRDDDAADDPAEPPVKQEKIRYQSHAVVMEPLHPAVQVEQDDERIKLHTSGLSVIYHIPDARFSFYYDGDRILQEHDGFVQNEDDDGYRVNFRISETEMLMGGGSRALGMDRRGERLELYNRAHYGYQTRSELINFTLPVVLSSAKYAVHFDNPTTGYLDLDSQNDGTLGFEAHSGRQAYQIITGDRWEDITENYTELTGRQPLPPRWTFGSFASRFGYRSQEEVKETVARYHEEEIPLDAVILDLFWFGQEVMGTMGNLAFDEETFPEPARMVSDLEEAGVRTVLITEPFVLTTSDRWDEVVEEEVLALDTLGNPAVYDFFFGETGLIDVFKPEGEQWFWNIYQELKENYGIHGWWGDLGEPEVHPDWVHHHGGTARDVHNIYGHQWGKLIHEGYERHYPDKRPFILMRAGYSGSQRIGMIPWTGDVSRSWGGLMPQPEISLQMGLQGIAYMHSDLGGFAGDLVDDELYVRWMQYGVFQPVYRPHAQEDVPPEPVFRSEKAMNLTKKAIELRYRLLPYIYTAAFQNAQTGIPLMRPLFFEEPDNHAIYRISGTYLFGDDILAAPVLRQGEREVAAYLPDTGNWFDFYTGEAYEGGKRHWIPTKEDRIPTFVRGGAVIPLADLVQSTENYSVEHLTLKYFFDDDASGYQTTIYHDDGLTRDAFGRDMYEKLLIGVEPEAGDEDTGRQVTITFETETGDAFSDGDGFSEISLHAANFPADPESVVLNGEETGFSYDPESKIMEVSTFLLESGRNVLKLKF